jgi:hypothetical protein
LFKVIGEAGGEGGELGTVIDFLHLGQFVVRPAQSSGAETGMPQEQLNRIMGVSLSSRREILGGFA